MGGNGGTQTLTIIVRGIALGELTFKNAKRIFFKEIGVGILTGAATGLVTAIVAVLWSGKTRNWNSNRISYDIKYDCRYLCRIFSTSCFKEIKNRSDF